MTDNAHPLTKRQRIKVEAVRAATFMSQLCMIYGLFALFLALPFWKGLALWALGVIPSHIWAFKTTTRCKDKERRFVDNLQWYARDSGLVMIVLGWPISVSLLILPEYVEHLLEKMLGIRWEAGKRVFD